MISNARFILKKATVHSQYERIRKIADFVSYSYKTNSLVGDVLKEGTDSWFSIHTIESAKRLSCPERVWFLAQAWEDEEISELIEMGIRRYIVDNELDLTRLLSFIEKKEIRISLLLRMRLKENTIHTGKHFVFGMFSEEVKRWLPRIKENRFIDETGIHFHRKTQNLSEWALKFELESIFSEDLLRMMDYVNIGGGLPAEYKNYRKDSVDNIFRNINELKAWLNSLGIRMIVEPGRYIAAPSIILEATIKNIYNNNIVLDASVWNSAMDTFISDIRLLVEGELLEGIPYTIKGSTPDSMDIFRYRVFLPEKKIGETIRFLNAGAYNFHTNFCNIPKIDTILVD